MKRLITLILASAFLLSLVGCQELMKDTGKKSGVLKAWSGEFSEERLKSAINEYKNDYVNIVYAQNGATVSFETDFEAVSCSVSRLSHVDDNDISTELDGYIDLYITTNCNGRSISVPIDWWLSDGNNYMLWSYLLRVKDIDGRDHYFYFRVDYSEIKNNKN
jgi:hypothetical protein